MFHSSFFFESRRGPLFDYQYFITSSVFLPFCLFWVFFKFCFVVVLGFRLNKSQHQQIISGLFRICSKKLVISILHIFIDAVSLKCTQMVATISELELGGCCEDQDSWGLQLNWTENWIVGRLKRRFHDQLQVLRGFGHSPWTLFYLAHPKVCDGAYLGRWYVDWKWHLSDSLGQDSCSTITTTHCL